MDISGPVREVLRRHIPALGAAGDPLTFFVRAVALPEERRDAVPAFLTSGPAILEVEIRDGAGQSRPVYRSLALACMLRIVPRLHRTVRDAWCAALQRHVAGLPEQAQKLLVQRSTTPAAFLWQHWLLVLAQRRLKLSAPEMLVNGMWRRGMGGQAREGHLHPRSAEMALEALVYEDFCALHAAYNAAAFLEHAEWFKPLERLVEWHVANTQPDNTTSQPWALAAFAGLDATGLFAQQQLHDVMTRLASAPPPRRPVRAARRWPWHCSRMHW